MIGTMNSERLRVYPNGEGLSTTGTAAWGTLMERSVKMAGMVSVRIIPAKTLASVQATLFSLDVAIAASPHRCSRPIIPRLHRRGGRHRTSSSSGQRAGTVSSQGLPADLTLQEPQPRQADLNNFLHLDLPDADSHVRAVLNVDRLPLQQRVDLDVLHLAIGQPQGVLQKIRSSPARLIQRLQPPLEVRE